MSLQSLWRAYIDLYNGRSVTNLTLPEMDRSRHRRAAHGSKKILVVNTNRLDDLELVKIAVRNKDRLLSQDHIKADFVLIDVALDRRTLVGSDMRSFVVVRIACSLLPFLYMVLRHGSFAGGIIEILRRWIRRTRITELELFSSNSRLIECLRLAAIFEGISITEFLHGSIGRHFVEYFEIIEKLSMVHDASLLYINMLPSLPQTGAITRHMLRRGGLEVYFRNERPWAPQGDELYDILLVGGAIQNGNYITTEFFLNEIKALKECNAANLRTIYCPHPSNIDVVRPYIPGETAMGSVAAFANSSKVLIGHYSTVLFTAKMSGYDVLLFPASWSLISDGQAALFGDPEKNTYRLETAVDMVGRSEGMGGAIRRKSIDGYSLI